MIKQYLPEWTLGNVAAQACSSSSTVNVVHNRNLFLFTPRNIATHIKTHRPAFAAMIVGKTFEQFKLGFEGYFYKFIPVTQCFGQ